MRGRAPYELYRQLLLTNIDSVLLDYWADVTEQELPPSFVKALAHKLAADMAISVTEERTRAEYFVATSEKLVSEAIIRDLQARPEEPVSTNDFLDVRYGGNTTSVWNDGRWR